MVSQDCTVRIAEKSFLEAATAWATETLYTVEPFLPWLKDLLGLAAP
jgi:hypothetical protein